MTMPYAAAAVLFQQTWTGAELLNDPNAVFPSSRSTTLSGTALDFGPGTAKIEKLFELPILDAGIMPTTAAGYVDIVINATIPPGGSFDNDLTIAVMDTSDVVGFTRGDNSGGTVWTLEGEDASPALTTYNYTYLGTPGIFPAEFEAHLTLDTTTTVQGVLGSASIPSYTAVRVLDRGAPLRVAAIADNAPESYRIHSISVTVSTDAILVPEPGSLAMAVLAVVSAGGLARVARRGIADGS